MESIYTHPFMHPIRVHCPILFRHMFFFSSFENIQYSTVIFNIQYKKYILDCRYKLSRPTYNIPHIQYSKNYAECLNLHNHELSLHTLLEDFPLCFMHEACG